MGAVAALASVVAAMVSDRGLVAGIAVPVAVGVVNGALVAWGRLQPYIVTLAMLLAARGMAGVLLAAQYGGGQPAEGVGWELTAIAAVVVGGTLLTGGLGSVAGTLWGCCCSGSSSMCSTSRTDAA